MYNTNGPYVSHSLILRLGVSPFLFCGAVDSTTSTTTSTTVTTSSVKCDLATSFDWKYETHQGLLAYYQTLADKYPNLIRPEPIGVLQGRCAGQRDGEERQGEEEKESGEGWASSTAGRKEGR